MRRILFNFLNYFTDILLIKCGIPKIKMNNIGTFIPAIAKLGQKYENLNNIAIMWQIYWG